MDDHKVGKGKPPKRFQFKKGTSGNPKGRPKRAPFSVAQAIINVLDGPVKFREGGTLRTANRRQLSALNHVRSALGGDVGSAAILLRLLAHAERFGDMRARRIVVTNWLPDYPGQTGPQKTREFAASKRAKTPLAQTDADRSRDVTKPAKEP